MNRAFYEWVSVILFLFFLHECEYLCEKYRDDRDEAKKDDLPDRREEYRRKSEYRSQREYNRTDL